jgi:hypothetical protein
MTTKPLDPLVSEFATQADADRYERWLRAKVAASLNDPRPSVPHDEAMARVDATLAAASGNATPS